ncbi:MAG: hypothetical protein JW850_22615 [Thermoflexales bacterium]|nr:hypothetical protein [Thermoflexales bacterium]
MSKKITCRLSPDQAGCVQQPGSVKRRSVGDGVAVGTGTGVSVSTGVAVEAGGKVGLAPAGAVTLGGDDAGREGAGWPTHAPSARAMASAHAALESLPAQADRTGRR